jgi:hypothetical protein
MYGGSCSDFGESARHELLWSAEPARLPTPLGDAACSRSSGMPRSCFDLVILAQ